MTDQDLRVGLTDLVESMIRRWRIPCQLARVLRYNIWGHSDAEIARRLGLSIHTITAYQADLRRRTGCPSKHAYVRVLIEASERDDKL